VRVGHSVTLFERADRIGGLLRYGIPDFKLEKAVLDRRVRQMQEEGVIFRPATNVGVDFSTAQLRDEFDAIVLAGGATQARDLPIPGRELSGIHLAVEYLTQQNRVGAGDVVDGQITARGKRVVVLGGGDTGSDCVGTANRQGAARVQQLELLPRPPETRTMDLAPWPEWAAILRTSSSHEEGVLRDWSVNTKCFSGGASGNVSKLHVVRVGWEKDQNGRPQMTETPGSEFEIECDLVLLALGFLGPERKGPISDLGLELDPRGNVLVDGGYMSSVQGVFSCGDMRRGQSLVVWAIWEGRECARGVDLYLMGRTDLPSSPPR
jgi:glutamate synthase (NADPH) small chain